MRSYILLLALAAITLGSCTTAYKAGQTPDDVYYSPTRPQDEYIVSEQRQEDRYYSGSQDYYTDRYLSMRLNNPYRWSALDDYYFNNPYVYNYYGAYNNWYSPWNSYWAWNSYFNPYYISPIFIKNPIQFREVPSRTVAFNPKSYLNAAPLNRMISSKPGINTAGRTGNGSYYTPANNGRSGSTRYNNSNNNQRSYSNSNSNNSSNSYNTPRNSTPTRTYNPPANSSNSSSSGSRSTSAPTRPPR